MISNMGSYMCLCVYLLKFSLSEILCSFLFLYIQYQLIFFLQVFILVGSVSLKVTNICQSQEQLNIQQSLYDKVEFLLYYLKYNMG